MAEVNFWPYGNAHETQTSSGEWEFSCQHGDAECQYNLIETCVVNLTSCPYKAYDILSCMEKKDRISKYEQVTKSCAPDNFDEIWACYTGADVNAMQHDIAVQTENLVPAHQYVPWMTVNGAYDED